MTKINERFIGQYSLQKTLRFELRPVGETEKLLEDFKNQVQGNLLGYDKERAQIYPVVKKILDDYYRYFIDSALSNFSFDPQTIQNAFELYKKTKKDADAVKEYAAITKKLRVQISQAFKSQIAVFMLDKYEKLFKSDGSKLYEWLNIKKANGEISAEDYIEADNSLQKFDRFTTYFTGFKDNRDNLFVDDEKATAISYRVVNENMPRFFENCIRMEKILSSYPDLYEELKSFGDAFIPQKFADVLSQRAITDYNNILGRPGQNADEKGVNSLINHYRQSNRINNRDLPVMVQLYKQLLSDRISAYSYEKINSDEEMVTLVAETLDFTRETASAISRLAAEHIITDNSCNIYINGSSLENLSQRLYGSWDFIQQATEKRLQQLRGKQKNNLEKALKTAVSVDELQSIVDEYIAGLDDELKQSYTIIPSLCEYMQVPPLAEFEAAASRFEQTSKEVVSGGELINAIKEVLDKALAVVRFYKPLYLFKGRNPLEILNRDENFYNAFEQLFAELNGVSRAYDMVRNYATKKQLSKDKIKLNFNQPTLLGGWDLNKEQDNLATLYIKNDKFYYLGISNVKNRPDFQDAIIHYENTHDEEVYQKVIYKQIADVSKDIVNLFSDEKGNIIRKTSGNKEDKKNAEENNSDPREYLLAKYIPEDILKIIKEKTYTNNKDDLKSLIEYRIKCASGYKNWEIYNLQFKKPEEYDSYDEFINHITKQKYMISLDSIPERVINEWVKEGKLYLFQIYNKDFSPYSKGKPNLHTTYWRMLFDEENLLNIAESTDSPVFKLNGEAEIFFREALMEKKITHPKGQPIINKNPNNPKFESVFDKVDLIKDKHYTEDKLLFHCPITINFRTAGVTAGIFNRQVNYFAEGNPEVNIIGIDRGERHLLYYTVINQRGEILDQGSLNNIHNSYTSAGQNVERDIDYRGLLHEREKQREEARKNWETIENIKELKAGYLSQVVHELSRLMIKYNAVIVLEDLNAGFKRSRIKVEKQVYQKFEKAMIDKLNYLVFKDMTPGNPGHYLKGYQLTAPFTSFRELGRQSGFLYYVYPSYTSHVCPKTGFVNLMNTRYENLEKAQDFFGKFDRINYQPADDYFEFHFDYKKFGKEMYRNPWTVCTFGDRRHYYESSSKTTKEYNVTEEIKILLNKYGIDYETGSDLLPALISSEKKGLLSSLMFLLGLTMQMRYTVSGTSDQDDYILSPVQDETGRFFDSRNASKDEPKNADANGAYHIALKGLKMISSISDGKVKTVSKKEMQEWFAYIQKKEYR